jgi:hypothetical protein
MTGTTEATDTKRERILLMVFLALIDWLNGERGQFGSTERGFTVLLYQWGVDVCMFVSFGGGSCGSWPLVAVIGV